MINLITKGVKSLFKTSYAGHETPGIKNEVVIITGASRGIGKALAEVLYKNGARLVLIARGGFSQANSQEFDSKRVLLIKADITRQVDIKGVIRKTLKKFEKVDVLINNAGQFIDRPLEKTSAEEYESVIATNIKGTFLMAKAVIPYMKKQRDGLIVNVGSKISRNTNVSPNKVLYATSKYAVEGFSFALNKELKPFGIRVTCLMPGTVNTFASLKSRQYLSPYDVAELILMIIKFKNIDFESIVFKSKAQNI